MYIAVLVIPVPADKKDAYRAWAAKSAAFFRDYGCLEVIDSWEDHVPVGKVTDFRRAVAARDGEKIAVSWQIWPDKASLDAAEARMHEDPRMEDTGDIPFDAARLILGCFAPLSGEGG